MCPKYPGVLTGATVTVMVDPVDLCDAGSPWQVNATPRGQNKRRLFTVWQLRWHLRPLQPLGRRGVAGKGFGAPAMRGGWIRGEFGELTKKKTFVICLSSRKFALHVLRTCNPHFICFAQDQSRSGFDRGKSGYQVIRTTHIESMHCP